MGSENDGRYAKVEQKYHSETEVAAYGRKRFERPGGELLSETQVRAAVDLVGERNKRVIEVGCGTGRFTFDLARAGHDVTALDYSPAMLAVCKERQAAEGVGDKVVFEQGSIFELPFEDGTFDAALSVHVLMHLPDYLKAIDELLRVVRPGGHVVFDIRNSQSLNRVAYPLRRAAQRVKGKDPWYVWYSTRREIAAIAEARGARVTEVRGMFPIKPNNVPDVAMPLIRWLSREPRRSFLAPVGHIQMICITKDE